MVDPHSRQIACICCCPVGERLGEHGGTEGGGQERTERLEALQDAAKKLRVDLEELRFCALRCLLQKDTIFQNKSFDCFVFMKNVMKRIHVVNIRSDRAERQGVRS